MLFIFFVFSLLFQSVDTKKEEAISQNYTYDIKDKRRRKSKKRFNVRFNDWSEKRTIDAGGKISDFPIKTVLPPLD